MRIIHPSLLLCAFVACATSEAKTPDDITIELSSVTLADNCPTPAVQPPPPGGFAKPPPAQTQRESQTQPQAARGSCARPPCPSIGRSRACEQTSMQLAFSQAGAKQTTIQIKRVELLDDKGKLLQTLTASMPAQWDAAKGSYIAWDGALAAKSSVKSTYRLTAPDWNKLGGRFNAQARKFQLRVIVTVGGADRTVEKTSIIPAHIEPMVVT
jgi:hypothetical protein